MNTYYNSGSYASIPKEAICDGCMNGCPLTMPGCQKGKDKAKGGASKPADRTGAQKQYLARMQRRVEQALEAGFSQAAVIPQAELVFVPEYRKYCEENRCGNFGKNYACPPYAGTAEELRMKTAAFHHVLVLRSDHTVLDAMNSAETGPLKAEHNRRTRELARQMARKYRREDHLVITAGPCNLCSPCKMAAGEVCPAAQERTSCLSAYCIDVGRLAESAGMELGWEQTKTSFFSLYLF